MSQLPSLAEQLEALVNGGSRPTWDEYFMATAVLVSSRSSCERLHVGCIIVSTGKHPNRLVAAGYNGFLPGAPHDSHVRDGHELATRTAPSRFAGSCVRASPFDGRHPGWAPAD